MCMFGMSACEWVNVLRGQKAALGPLQLELQAVRSQQTRVGNLTEAFYKSGTLNRTATSPAHSSRSIFNFIFIVPSILTSYI